MDKEKIEEILKKVYEKTKYAYDKTSKYIKENYPSWKYNTMKVVTRLGSYAKISGIWLKNNTINLVKYTKENYPIFKDKVIVMTKVVYQKAKLIYKEIKANPKQAITAGIILLIAILFLILGLSNNTSKDKVVIPDVTVSDFRVIDTSDTKVDPNALVEVKPTNVVFNFTATMTKPITFDVFYTLKCDTWFDESHKIKLDAQEGTKEYSVVLPADKIYRIRLDFDKNPGEVTIANMYLSGAQEYDLNNFARYELNQLENVIINEDGSITFTSDGYDPYMAYRPCLIR
jgi:hypothetical protein